MAIENDERSETASCCCSSATQPEAKAPSCGCGGASTVEPNNNYGAEKPRWITGIVKTAAGDVPKISTVPDARDKLETFVVRTGTNRMDYKVKPGLYAVGSPSAASPVLVSANFKLSFDALRGKLTGRDAWILVLDTKGINVWCAAGKGTFGTDEIVRRAEAARLAEIVSHRTLVVPQLGAPGVSAHEVKRRCGFRVVYGPVRAADLCAFLDAGMKATPEMRRVRFPIRDRMVLIPVEGMVGIRYALITALIFLILSLFGNGGVSAQRILTHGIPSALVVFGVYAACVSLTPTLLPWLPGRAFAVKGAFVGLLIAAGFLLLELARPGSFANGYGLASLFLIIPAAASFIGMNFTGSSTYTSLSGVKHEMRIALPIQAGCAAAGLILMIAGKFIH